MKTDNSGRVYIDPKVVQQDRELQIRNMMQTKQLTIEVIKRIAKEHGKYVTPSNRYFMW